jgi:hypothetical protein
MKPVSLLLAALRASPGLLALAAPQPPSSPPKTPLSKGTTILRKVDDQRALASPTRATRRRWTILKRGELTLDDGLLMVMKGLEKQFITLRPRATSPA